MSVETTLQTLRKPHPVTKDYCLPESCKVIKALRNTRGKVFVNRTALVRVCRDGISITEESDAYLAGNCISERDNPPCGHIWGSIIEVKR